MFPIQEFLMRMATLVGQCTEMAMTTWDDAENRQLVYGLRWFTDDQAYSVSVRFDVYDLLTLFDISMKIVEGKSLISTDPSGHYTEERMQEMIFKRLEEKVLEFKSKQTEKSDIIFKEN